MGAWGGGHDEGGGGFEHWGMYDDHVKVHIEVLRSTRRNLEGLFV